MNRGDIYEVTLDPTSGHEQRGYRPVLVISPASFNAVTRLPVVLPITNSGQFVRGIGFAVQLSGKKTVGVVRCDQPRVLDISARNGRKIETISTEIMAEVLAKLATICEA